jgi:hypothetical protein
MKANELRKLLDKTFKNVEFDVFEDIEGLVRVNFVVDIEEDEDETTDNYLNDPCNKEMEGENYHE